MALRGKAKIQVFDKNMSIKHEVIEENLITNAAQNIVSLAGKDFFLGSRANYTNHLYYHLPNTTPIATELFGGILLFESPIEGNANTIFPPVGSVPIGHAGKSYSGPNVNRGAYNIAESGPLYEGTNIIGYRHVWDFATDKCNGTIGCLCLTSTLGGNTGWKAPSVSTAVSNTSVFDADTTSEVYLSAGSSISNKPFSTMVSNKGYTVFGPLIRGASSNGVHLFYINEETGDFYCSVRYGGTTSPFAVLKGSIPRDITLGLSSVVNDVSGVTPVQLFTLNNPRLNGRHSIWFDDASSSFHILYVGSESTLIHETYSLTGAALSTKTITMPGGTKLYQWSSPNVNPFIYKGHYYATIIDPSNAQAIRLARFSDDGSLITSFPWYSPTNVLFSTHTYVAKVVQGLDRVSFRREALSNYNEGYETFFDGETFNTFKTFDDTVVAQYVDCSNPVLPGFYMSYAQPYQGYVNVFYKFIPTYLASINNLATQIDKTSADTMKITYDLYAE